MADTCGIEEDQYFENERYLQEDDPVDEESLKEFSSFEDVEIQIPDGLLIKDLEMSVFDFFICIKPKNFKQHQ